MTEAAYLTLLEPTTAGLVQDVFRFRSGSRFHLNVLDRFTSDQRPATTLRERGHAGPYFPSMCRTIRTSSS